MLRWLLPVIAALAVLGASVSAWAAAGVIGDPSCCCPVKTACECHDHDDGAPAAPILKKCGGEARLVAAAIAHATLPAPTTVIATVVGDGVRAVTADLYPDAPTYEPETPPF